MTSLDELLSQPLAKVEDNLFSEKIIKRINHYCFLRNLILMSLTVFLFIGFIFTLPIHSLFNSVSWSKSLNFFSENFPLQSLANIDLSQISMLQPNVSTLLVLGAMVFICIDKLME